MVIKPYMRLSVLALGASLLAGCEQAEELSKQAASAVAGRVAAEVKQQTDQAIDQLASEVDNQLAPLGVSSSAVASQVKSQIVTLSQALKPDSDWAMLATLTGATPQTLGLLTPVSPIMPELQKLLGQDLPAWQSAMQKAGPLQVQDGVLYTLASEPKGDTAWLLIDAQNRKLEAGLRSKGKEQVWASKGESLRRPDVLAQALAK
ncbi:hypothetical protein [Chitinilyticum litopenaei]|uniref:hypothetical protein n=1 Tax=Chitinilyticum litopenaei TaxID=1121276 RepID=UPI0004232F63|nr:hypothetical protein [Chitinilyticum litopenaei]